MIFNPLINYHNRVIFRVIPANGWNPPEGLEDALVAGQKGEIQGDVLSIGFYVAAFPDKANTGQAKLDAMTADLQANYNPQATIEGYPDVLPPPPYNPTPQQPLPVPLSDLLLEMALVLGGEQLDLRPRQFARRGEMHRV